MKKNKIDSCSVFFGIVLLVIGVHIVYQIAVFFKRPDAIVQIINSIEAIGICIGAIIAFFIIVYLLESLSSSIKNRFRRQSKIFPGRAYVKLMVPFDHDPIPEDLPEAPNQATSFPISVNLAMTNYGLWITTNNPKEKETPPHSNEVNISKGFLNTFDNSIIIPISNIDLYYLAYHRNGLLEFEMGPSKSPGFKDRIPKLPKGDSLKIIIVFSCILKRDFLGEVVKLKQPIKMKLIVQNQDGTDDLLATSKLYKLIYDKKQEIEARNDDSWMYRSRPMYW